MPLMQCSIVGSFEGVMAPIYLFSETTSPHFKKTFASFEKSVGSSWRRSLWLVSKR
jgi:hypothetical protein